MKRSFLGRRAVVPAHVRAALEALFGTSVESVEIIEHSLFARLHFRAVATTRRQRIYLRGPAEDFFADPALMLHEYCHVLNQWEPGALTVGRYVLEWLRRGYWNNRFEIEARDFAHRYLQHFRAMLARELASTEQRLAMVEAPGNQREHNP